uniref:RRM domain-containing protein n=1 Tax=Alexandrium monilatum TaxID=311494 RepID=A0A7S4QAX7_9DINO|mmetsp:Transcript_47188/g.140852  ORF Transcript_47188/g.140852 Transcript_47188/m.140852 type:complete len:343 (-) Transcript_47188:122-1150(-)
MAEISSKIAGSSRIFFRGAPADTTSEAAKGFFAKYGDIDDCYAVPGQGCGYVEFRLCSSAEKVVKEGPLSLQGKTVEVKRALPPLAGGIDVGVAQQALIEPAKSSEALDVVVVRGHCTATGIGVAAMHAKAMTTVLVLWDHHHYPATEAAVAGALEKRVYNTMEEEMPDNAVMGKAFEYFGVGAPKCALVHVGSDKIKQSVELENPLWNVDEVISGIECNHLETLQSFYAAVCYQPWIHAFRAVCFMLIPPMMGWDWPDDICTCTVSTRRTVKANPLRSADGSGWTVGLQMTNDSPVVNASLAFAAMNKVVFSDESLKHQYTGKTLNLNMPTPDIWFKKGAE